MLFIDGDIVRCGVGHAKVQVQFEIRFKCFADITVTFAQVEKYTYTTNYRRQNE